MFELGSNDRHRGKTHCCWTQNMLCLFTLLASQFFAVIMASSRCSAGVSPPDERTPGLPAAPVICLLLDAETPQCRLWTLRPPGVASGSCVGPCTLDGASAACQHGGTCFSSPTPFIVSHILGACDGLTLTPDSAFCHVAFAAVATAIRSVEPRAGLHD
ncbi:uncharacterized protein LOC114670330 isoform X3 [Macaca mulatta]